MLLCAVGCVAAEPACTATRFPKGFDKRKLYGYLPAVQMHYFSESKPQKRE